jgi:monoamine oxidase
MLARALASARRTASSRPISRRTFLKAAGAATAGAALVACTPGRKVDSDARIAIIGAGLAGLVCARRLAQAGLKPRVFEASQHLGGRVKTSRGPLGTVELGGEFIGANHTSMRRLVSELELTLADLDEIEADDGFFFLNGRRWSYEQIEREMAPVAEAVERDARQLRGPVTYDNHNGGEALDRTSIAEWLDSHDIDGVARKAVEIIYTTEFGLDLDEQSALNLFGEDDTDVERFVIEEGADAIATRIGDELPLPVEVGYPITGLFENGNSYELTVQDLRNRQPADFVVVAVPFTALRQIGGGPGPGVLALAIDRLGYGRNTKVIAGFDRAFWRPGSADTYSDLPYTAAWETNPGGNEPIALTNFTGGRAAQAAENKPLALTTDDLLHDLDQVHGGATDAHNGKVLRSDWIRNEWIQGSYACYKPGQYTTIAGLEGQRAGNMLFAGEHTSRSARGYMEGAVESGERAARTILADL